MRYLDVMFKWPCCYSRSIYHQIALQDLHHRLLCHVFAYVSCSLIGYWAFLQMYIWLFWGITFHANYVPLICCYSSYLLLFHILVEGVNTIKVVLLRKVDNVSYSCTELQTLVSTDLNCGDANVSVENIRSCKCFSEKLEKKHHVVHIHTIISTSCFLHGILFSLAWQLSLIWTALHYSFLLSSCVCFSVSSTVHWQWLHVIAQ